MDQHDATVPVQRASWRLGELPFVVAALDRVDAWDATMRTRWPFRALVGPELDPEVVPGDGTLLVVRPALLGLVALVAIAVGASQSTSPFALKLPGAWFFGVPSSVPGTGSNTSTTYFLGLVAVYGGLVLLARAWIGLVRTLRQVPGIPVRRLVLVLALWTVPLLIAPPLFSRDVYSYAAQGEMTSHHISPYLYGPATLGAGAPYERLVDPLWGNAPAPYGPLFLQIDGILTKLSFHHELGTVILLRLLEVAGVALLGLGITRLAATEGRDPALGFAFAVLSPVTMLHLLAGAHNDALMAGLLAVGLAVGRRGRPVAGIVLCALAAAVKAPGAIGVVYLGWHWMGEGVPWKERVRPLCTAGLIALGVLGFVSAESGLGWGWIANLASPGTVTSWMAPATGLGLLVVHLAHGLGWDVAQSGVLSVTRSAGLAGAMGICCWLLVRSERIGMLRAIGYSCLAVTVLGPVVQPWYLSWGLVLLAPVATGRTRSLVLGMSVLAAFLGLPGAPQLLENLLHASPLTVAVALVACLFILTVPLNSLPPVPVGGDLRDAARDPTIPGSARLRTGGRRRPVAEVGASVETP